MSAHKKCSKHNKLETDISSSKKNVLKSYKTAKRCGLRGSRDRKKKRRKVSSTRYLTVVSKKINTHAQSTGDEK